MPFYLADTQNKTNKKFQKIKKISPPLQKISKSDSPAPNGDFQKPGRRVAFRTLQKGSLVVEAAWSVPLFFLTVLALVSLMDIYGIYVAQMVQIQEEVEKMGMYAAAGEEDQTIDRSRTVAYHPLGLPFTVPGVQITCRGRVRAWTGRDFRDEMGKGGKGNEKEQALMRRMAGEKLAPCEASCHVKLDYAFLTG